MLKDSDTDFDRQLAERGTLRRFHEFENLIPKRAREILLVASLYDSYIFEEEGRLYEGILNEYIDMNLSNAPEITRAANGHSGIDLALRPKRFDLIITTLHLGDMDGLAYARKLRENGVNTPVVLLAFDNRELGEINGREEIALFEKVFVWQGDFSILVAIIKMIEDKLNVEHDTRAVGVQSIILIEDNAAFYSSFLPLVYAEVLRHHQRLISEGVNTAHRILRMRARPKILLCSTYEEALSYFSAYEDCILGVISDIEFPRNGESDSTAGLRFAEEVKRSASDIPILLQSNSPEYETEAKELGASFLLKSSPLFMHKLSRYIVEYFRFGDFIFRAPDGREIGRAKDLRDLEEQLEIIPEDSLRMHAERNHFSYWLKARTEFWLAHKLRPQKVSDYDSPADLRADLITSLREFRRQRGLGLITDFDPRTYVTGASFSRIGAGSLGGKARGLAFMASLIDRLEIGNRFDGVEVSVPQAIVLGTDLFEQFLEENDLNDFAIQSTDDNELYHRFLEAPLPMVLIDQLSEVLSLIRGPLAVRSSSLLEDSKYQPFAGIYSTHMIPNASLDITVRLWDLANAIKAVYASTYTQSAKRYFEAIPYRLEDERMAVIIQELVGQVHGGIFYPSLSGVVRSHNFYPTSPMQPDDGIASVALGLGKTVTDGGLTVRFCPGYPRHVVQFSDADSTLTYSQKEFYALSLEKQASREIDELSSLVQIPIREAEAHGTLQAAASTYSPENHAIYDGMSRDGMRVITFAPILKGDIFPLAEILSHIMRLGRWGMSSPVEIEFAADLSNEKGKSDKFAVLQIRPLVLGQTISESNVDWSDRSQAICHSSQVLGNGTISELRDIIIVDPERFTRADTIQIAAEVGLFNARLLKEKRSYLLIGMGRWGSADPFLGIPVSWDQISGARVIIESGFEDFDVSPSQGTHFFQNITSFQIGYFTVNRSTKNGFVDWDWLSSQDVEDQGKYIRHLRFEKPLTVVMDGHKNQGIIIKPK